MCCVVVVCLFCFSWESVFSLLFVCCVLWGVRVLLSVFLAPRLLCFVLGILRFFYVLLFVFGLSVYVCLLLLAFAFWRNPWGGGGPPPRVHAHG